MQPRELHHACKALVACDILKLTARQGLILLVLLLYDYFDSRTMILITITVTILPLLLL